MATLPLSKTLFQDIPNTQTYTKLAVGRLEEHCALPASHCGM
jgi:hypothetical protein